ncbi:MAG: DUF5011 domain-containing protein [Patescibacteria group bacterium]|nr:DUF5011 domain-containing protein [Patescibacteria group bacterium]
MTRRALVGFGIATAFFTVAPVAFAAGSLSITSIATDNLINASEKSAIVVTGVADAAGDSVTVTLTDSSTNSASSTGVADGSGNFSITVNGSSLVDGAITSSANDTTSSNSVSGPGALLDTVAPILDFSPTPADPDVTNDTTPTVGIATTEDGTVHSDCAFTSTTTALAASVRTFIDFATLSEGSHTCNIWLTDAAGNQSNTKTVNFQIDTTPPTLTSVNIQSLNANPSYAKTGNKVTVSFTTSESVPTPTVTIDGNAASASGSGGTDWSAFRFFNGSEPEGVVSFSISFADPAGNAGFTTSTTTDSSSVTFDKTAPVITETSALSSPTASTSPFYIFNSSEAGTTTVGGSCSAATLSTAAGSNTISLGTSGDGTYNCTVQVADFAGNTSNTLSPSFNLVTSVTTPTISLTNDTGTSNSDLLTKDASLTISGVPTGATRYYKVDSAATSTTYTPNALSDGVHTVRVTDVDGLGNSGTNSITFTLDRTITTPTVSLSSDTGSSASDRITSNASITQSAVDADASRTYTLDGGAPSGSYTAPSANGSHTLVLTDTDAAGNTASASLTFTLDTTKPAIDAHANSFNNEATSSSGVSVVYTAPTAHDNIDADFAASCTPATRSLFALGSTTVNCTAQDAAGNSATSTSFVVGVVDTTGPVITLNGSASTTVSFGSTFSDPGATATDAVDGAVSVSTSGSVDTGTAGDYILTYSAQDSRGNASSTIRTVTVQARVVQSGGGGGGGPIGNTGIVLSIIPTLPGSTGGTPAPAPTPQPTVGQVLGAAGYHFTRYLTMGSRGQDVTELQKILIADGYLKIKAPTGYYGVLTAAAVRLYQKAHGIIPTTGTVGTLTRAALNASTGQ